MNRKAMRFYAKNAKNSPWFGGWLPRIPHTEDEARRWLVDSEQLQDNMEKRLRDVVDEMCSVYHMSCRAWLALEFEQVEECKKTYAELSTAMLHAIDTMSTATKQREVCVEWLDNHGLPLNPDEPPLVQPMVGSSGEPKLRQGSLFD